MMRRHRSHPASANLRRLAFSVHGMCQRLLDIPELDFSTCWFPGLQLVVTTQCQVGDILSSTRADTARNGTAPGILMELDRQEPNRRAGYKRRLRSCLGRYPGTRQAMHGQASSSQLKLKLLFQILCLTDSCCRLRGHRLARDTSYQEYFGWTDIDPPHRDAVSASVFMSHWPPKFTRPFRTLIPLHFSTQGIHSQPLSVRRPPICRPRRWSQGSPSPRQQALPSPQSPSSRPLKS